MNNNILKYLVPIIAIVVLVESVMIISNLKSKSVAPTVVEETTPVISEAPKADSVYQMNLIENNGRVDVSMVGNSDRSLDSINVYVKYDPAMVEIGGLSFDKKLPVPAFSKVSTTRGLIVANFLVADVKGLSVKSGEVLKLMSFNFKPLKSGKVDFEISTGSELKESATMIVENVTSKVMPFSSNKLTVNATL